MVRLARTLALTVGMHRSTAVTLQDNRPTSGALTKGRSPSFPLNLICRQKAAACLAAQLRLIVPWCETSKQPADWVSRLIDDE